MVVQNKVESYVSRIATNRLGFSGKLTIILSVWSTITLAVFSYMSNHPVHTVIWSVLSVLFFVVWIEFGTDNTKVVHDG